MVQKIKVTENFDGLEMTMIYTTPSTEDLQDAVERISWT
jgi:hypothetical protein